MNSCRLGLFFFLFLIFGCDYKKETFSSPDRTELPYFGLHIHGADKLTPWPSFSFGSWRLWDAKVTWADLEPAKGEWDFSKLDAYVELAQKHNVELILPLGMTPQWASARPLETSAYGLGRASEPASISDWDNYVETVVKRYYGKIKYYELWNEPNLKQFYSGSIEDLKRLNISAYNIVKKFDPDAFVISPSATENVDWLDRYLGLGVDGFIDIVGYHFYFPNSDPEALVDAVVSVRSVLHDHGITKPLWNTESGWRIENKLGGPNLIQGVPANWNILTEFKAAQFVSRALILGRVLGVDKFFLYAWDNAQMGLIEPLTKKEKLSAVAYKKTIDWLLGGRISCDRRSSFWLCSVIFGDGRVQYIVWSQGDGEKLWIPPERLGVTRYQILNGEFFNVLPGQSLDLSLGPILLLSDGFED